MSYTQAHPHPHPHPHHYRINHHQHLPINNISPELLQQTLLGKRSGSTVVQHLSEGSHVAFEIAELQSKTKKQQESLTQKKESCWESQGESSEREG